MAKLPRLKTASIARAGILAYDVAISVAAFLAAFTLAYGYPWRVPAVDQKATAFGLICVVCFYSFAVPRGSWRHVSIPELKTLIKASLLSVLIYTVGAFLVSRGDNIPRSVPPLTIIFMLSGMAAARLTYRMMTDGSSVRGLWRFRRPLQSDRSVIICGMTDAAEAFIRSSQRVSRAPVRVVGILDDGDSHRASTIQGVRVLGRVSELETILAQLRFRGTDVKELVIADQSSGRQWLRDTFEAGTRAGLKVSRIPLIAETSSVTSATLLEPRPIEIGDLLGRAEVKTDMDSVAALIQGRVVLVTGAGGSIGSELCRQIVAIDPAELIVIDNSEYNIYRLDNELRQFAPKLKLNTQVADVRDRNRINALMASVKPEIVFHAAALKHVPLMEANPLEGLKTNVLGTRNVADAALEHGVATFVMISTDKAVNPANIMGATKRAAEAYCQALDVTSTSTRFKTVRFGNVLSSAGSVVPRFQEQIAAGGPVTVTHPKIVRFFMTIPEAVRLVLHASAQGLKNPETRGRIMVLDMGKPVSIVDLAERMIELAGFRPRVDIDIVFTGLRPGEKLYEELFDPTEIQSGRTQEGFVIAAPRVIDKALLHRTLNEMEATVAREDAARGIELLSHIVPEYEAKPSSVVEDDEDALSSDTIN
ncbi:polysaccharide biosynthesis protein [Mesorhizobium sp. RP14(2022)]|uniref:Polysaccharide biosynthesis protein n=1 Tax=Mesorhizobium liriopis TaxID=2953882 RepID=A0ABT1C0Z0_9HYPH|nr:nucleoside-diphosphate sugar epimerase/dehydratase [Mesorhizobium liriopis]MCO6048492.1 polysaccharide biosynthesis protein [Mesorhizobium liriopis]